MGKTNRRKAIITKIVRSGCEGKRDGKISSMKHNKCCLANAAIRVRLLILHNHLLPKKRYERKENKTNLNSRKFPLKYCHIRRKGRTTWNKFYLKSFVSSFVEKAICYFAQNAKENAVQCDIKFTRNNSAIARVVKEIACEVVVA